MGGESEKGEAEGSVRAVAVMTERKGQVQYTGSRNVTCFGGRGWEGRGRRARAGLMMAEELLENDGPRTTTNFQLEERGEWQSYLFFQGQEYRQNRF